MTVRRLPYITREYIRENPRTLFVFGDNLQGKGYGGQAKEMRGEPNVVGIPTKRAPKDTPASYLSDANWDEVVPILDARFQALSDHIALGGDVIIPSAGVGTGLAELPTRAHAIFAYIQLRLHELETMG